MNQVQQEMVERLKTAILEKNSGSRGSEIKKLEIREFYNTVSMVIEVGMPGDEGTMASVFARDYRHIFIGPRGGLEICNTKTKTGKYRKSRQRGWINAVYAVT